MPSWQKSLERVGLKGLCLNIIKAIYDKPSANITINGEKLEEILLKSGIRQDCPPSSIPFNIVLKALAGAIKQRKKLKEYKQKELQFSLFASDIH